MGVPLRDVGFVRHEFLPASETFIYRSMKSIQDFRVRVFAVSRQSATKFPDGDVIALRQDALGWLESFLYKSTTWSPRWFAFARSVSLLHAHQGQTGPFGLLAASRFGLPLVTSFYGKDVTVAGSSTRFVPNYWHLSLLRGALFSRGDRFLALSEHMAERLVQQGAPRDRIRIVRLGIDLAPFEAQREARREGPVRVLMVGREVDKKGFDDGFRAVALAREAGADVRLTLLGNHGPGAPALKQLAASLQLDVDWPDPSSSVAEAMAAADVLMVPSRTAANGDQEGTPTVICEGGAASLPIVATRHAGIPEQIEDGVTGLLADERDADTMAKHLVRLAQDPELRVEMGRAGHDKIAREYSLDEHRRALEAVYHELLH